MQFNYKTQELLEKGVDFGLIYPMKQTVVKEMTGFDFDLGGIVSFLKKETNSFQEQIPLALDIDRQIFSIYTKWSVEEGKEVPTPQPSGEPSGEESEDKKKVLSEIEGLKEMVQYLEGEDKEKVEAEISGLTEMLDYL